MGLEKNEVNLTFQKYVTVDAKRKWTGPVKIKIDLSQGRYWSKT